jgi:alpha,alpha-trehalose phosphorylase
VGHLELAYDYFGEAALLDISDFHQNTKDGVHLASLSGAWIAAVAGFGGMRDHGDSLSFAPRLPKALARLAFRLTFHGRRIKVEIDHQSALYTLLDGDPLEIIHHGSSVEIRTGKRVTRPIPDAPARKAPRQPPGRAPTRRRPSRRTTV